MIRCNDIKNDDTINQLNNLFFTMTSYGNPGKALIFYFSIPLTFYLTLVWRLPAVREFLSKHGTDFRKISLKSQ